MAPIARAGVTTRAADWVSLVVVLIVLLLLGPHLESPSWSKRTKIFALTVIALLGAVHSVLSGLSHDGRCRRGYFQDRRRHPEKVRIDTRPDILPPPTVIFRPLLGLVELIMDTRVRPKIPEPAGRPKMLQVMGPGLITGASDDDPSGIATYSQVGAQFGYGLAWTLLFSYPLMTAIQEISIPASAGSPGTGISREICAATIPTRSRAASSGGADDRQHH